jgi:hypothetical protein
VGERAADARFGLDDFREGAGDAEGVEYSSRPVGKTVLYNLNRVGSDWQGGGEDLLAL